MAIPPSGPITMGMINTELGYPATQIISLNDAAVRALAQVPAGMISLSNFYGKSNITPAGYSIGAFGAWPTYAAISNIYEFNFSNETGSFLAQTSPTGTQLSGYGQTDSKSIVTPGSSTFIPGPNLFFIGLNRFEFSSKTFTAIAPSPQQNPGNTRYQGTKSRMQSTDNYYVISPYNPATPPQALNSRTGFTKYNLPTESFLNINTLIPPGQVSPVPTTENLFAFARTSWNAAKNYSRGWAFTSTSGTASMFYPTDTAFVNWGGPVTLDMGAYSPSTFATRANSAAAIQTSENGFTFGGYAPAVSGNVLTTHMSRFAFGPQTSIKNFQSVGVMRASFVGYQTPTNGFFLGGTSNSSPISPFNFISEIWKYQFPTGSMGTISQSMGNRNSNPYEIQSAPVFG